MSLFKRPQILHGVVSLLLVLGVAVLSMFYLDQFQAGITKLQQQFQDVQSPFSDLSQGLAQYSMILLVSGLLLLGNIVVSLWRQSAHTDAGSGQHDANNYFDPLTGLYSRAVLHDLLSHELARTKRAASNATVLMIAIDQMQTLRASGAAIANHACHEVGQSLKSTSRRGDYVFYLGDGIFLVYLSDCKERYTINAAERFRVAIESTRFEYRGNPLPLTIGVGIATSCELYEIDGLKTMAESALQQAIQAGNCSVLHSPV